MYRNAIIQLEWRICTFSIILCLYFHLATSICFEIGLWVEEKVTQKHNFKLSQAVSLQYHSLCHTRLIKKIVEVGLQVSEKVKSLYWGRPPQKHSVHVLFFQLFGKMKATTHRQAVFFGRNGFISKTVIIHSCTTDAMNTNDP